MTKLRDLVIDIHTHILPKNWPDLREKYGYGGFIRLEHHKPCAARMMMDDKFFREVQDNCWDEAVRQKECDHHKVDVQVLSTVPVMFSYWAKPEHTLDLSKFLNDHIAGIVDKYSQRFAGLGTLPMQKAEMAINELERCKEIGLLGVQIGTHVNDMNLDSPAVFDIFQAAEEMGLCVFIHPWDMLGTKEMPKYWLPWLVGMPAETSRAITSMIFGGVFEKLPSLRVTLRSISESAIDWVLDDNKSLNAGANPFSPNMIITPITIDRLVMMARMGRPFR